MSNTQAVEISEETLSLLPGLCEASARICDRLAGKLHASEGQDKLNRLLKGVEAILEAAHLFAELGRVSQRDRVRLLTLDLASTLQDLKEAQEDGHMDFVEQILAQDLKDNLLAWNQAGFRNLFSSGVSA